MMPRADLIRADRALWRAVISQAISDATLGLSTVTKSERSKAITWLTSNGPDFRRVCALADLEPERVRTYAKATIERAKSDPSFGRTRPRPQPLPKHLRPSRRTMVEFNGQTIDLITLCARYAISIVTVRSRLKAGVCLADALSHPTRQTGGRSKLQANEQGPAGVHPHKIAPNSGFSA